MNIEPQTKAFKKRNWFQRQWIIVPQLQHEIILAATFSTIGVFLVFLTHQFYVYYQLTGLVTSGELGFGPTGVENLHDQLQKQVILFAVCGIFALIFGFFFGLYVSHRIAGPLFRLNKQLDDLIRGEESSDLKFRPNDYMKDVADKVNILAQRLKKGDDRSPSEKSS